MTAKRKSEKVIRAAIAQGSNPGGAAKCEVFADEAPKKTNASRKSAGKVTRTTNKGCEPILNELRLVGCLEAVACLPEKLWSEVSMEIPQLHPDLGFSRECIALALENYRGSMLLQRYRLGRAVQPTGALHDLAPIVGAIRMKGAGMKYALKYLHYNVHKSVITSDGELLRRIAKLSEEKLAAHVNFYVWDAILDFVQKNEKIMAQSVCRQWTIAPVPDTRKIKEFVLKHKNDKRYAVLSQLDKSGWTRLCKNSGANMVIQEGRRGKNLH